jgi:hypothetical protein
MQTKTRRESAAAVGVEKRQAAGIKGRKPEPEALHDRKCEIASKSYQSCVAITSIALIRILS